MMNEDDSSTMQDLADEIVSALGVQSAIIVVKDARGFDAIAFAGVASHQDAVLLLANASHMVLQGHERAVLAGEAGPEHRAVAESLRG